MMLPIRPNRPLNVSIRMLGASAVILVFLLETKALNFPSITLPRSVMLPKFALHITFIMRKMVPKLDLYRRDSKPPYQQSSGPTS